VLGDNIGAVIRVYHAGCGAVEKQERVGINERTIMREDACWWKGPGLGRNGAGPEPGRQLVLCGGKRKGLSLLGASQLSRDSWLRWGQHSLRK
jgi:hypothetical protein